jgi:hypothetical protein
MPADADLTVKVGDKVKGGVTVIGKMAAAADAN